MSKDEVDEATKWIGGLDRIHSARGTYRALPGGIDPVLTGDLLTVAEVAALLKVPVSWVYERTRRRGTERMPHFKLGKYLRFREREVLDWLDCLRRN